MRRAYFPVLAVILILAQSSFAASATSLSGPEKLFLEGKYDEAISELDALIRCSSGRKDEPYYLKGLSELKAKRFDDARTSFNYILSGYPSSKKTFDARLGLGDSYLLEGNTTKALGVYNDMAARYPSDKNISIVHSRLSSCYAGMGLRDKADFYSDMTKREAPLSFEVKSAPAVIVSSQGSAKRKSTARSVVNAPGLEAKRAPAIPVLSNAEASRYSIQVGSFKSKANADKLAQKLAARGYDSYVAIPVSPGDKFYRVRIGKFVTRSEALKLAYALKSYGYNIKVCTNDICE